jgi:hypothetical protein
MSETKRRRSADIQPRGGHLLRQMGLLRDEKMPQYYRTRPQPSTGRNDFFIGIKYYPGDLDEARRAKAILNRPHLLQNKTWQWKPCNGAVLNAKRDWLFAVGTLTQVAPSAGRLTKKRGYMRKTRQHKSTTATRRRKISSKRSSSTTKRTRRTGRTR